MILPQLLPHCNHSHFCDSCRSLEKGRSFRTGVLVRQGIDFDIDFECPKGKPWNHEMIYNCIYYVCPILEMSHEWKNNITVFQKYAGIFNGKKVVLVAQDEGLASLATVRDYFNDSSFQFIPMKNNTQLGEVIPFMAGLRFVKSTKPNEATFYAHAKGVSPKYKTRSTMLQNIRIWRTAMYHFNLGNPYLIEEKLKTHSACGCFQSTYGFDGVADWHFAGTFFWFKHEKIFNEDWEKIRLRRHGVEIYLDQFMPKEEAYNIYPKQRNMINAYKAKTSDWVSFFEPTNITYKQVLALTEATND